MAATAINNRPADTLRERNGLKATIWKNSNSEGRSFFSVQFNRTFKTEQGYQDTGSFRETDLLILSRLVSKAYDRISDLRAEEAAKQADSA